MENDIIKPSLSNDEIVTLPYIEKDPQVYQSRIIPTNLFSFGNSSHISLYKDLQTNFLNSPNHIKLANRVNYDPLMASSTQNLNLNFSK